MGEAVKRKLAATDQILSSQKSELASVRQILATQRAAPDKGLDAANMSASQKKVEPQEARQKMQADFTDISNVTEKSQGGQSKLQDMNSQGSQSQLQDLVNSLQCHF